VASWNLLPSLGQLHVLEERVAWNDHTELDACGLESLLAIVIAVVVRSGRQRVAVDEALLAFCLLSHDGVWIATHDPTAHQGIFLSLFLGVDRDVDGFDLLSEHGRSPSLI